ncbi:MAG: hypothetical protein OHK93_002023 [Ramalina farinacea]|uniref:Uncharacterized protein n=1 Tax=Ramalina farinacea TaxID=258253 RepID=A0AA43TWS6_9LECA|nr:hypothetical protein [Ramalina farinacea]
MIGLYREAYGLPLNPSALKLAMLLARFALQRAAQDAGGQHLPLTKDFEYEAQGFTVAARQAGPGVPNVGKLLYSDVENMFTAIEQKLVNLAYIEANLQILRIQSGPRQFLGFGMIGKSKNGISEGDQSTSLNQTVTAIEKQLSIEVAPPTLVNDTWVDLNNGVNAGDPQPDVKM